MFGDVAGDQHVRATRRDRTLGRAGCAAGLRASREAHEIPAVLPIPHAPDGDCVVVGVRRALTLPAVPRDSPRMRVSDVRLKYFFANDVVLSSRSAEVNEDPEAVDTRLSASRLRLAPGRLPRPPPPASSPFCRPFSFG